jgi:hypothetical protein
MYGCVDAVPFFGFAVKDLTDEFFIGDEWLEKNNIQRWPSSLVRLHVTKFVYGVVASLDPLTGHMTVTAEEEKIVKGAYKKVIAVETFKDMAPPQFQLCVSMMSSECQYQQEEVDMPEEQEKKKKKKK